MQVKPTSSISFSSFSSFAIHFLVNSGGKSLKFGLQTKNICKNCYFIFSKLEKNYNATQRYPTNGSLSYVYIFSFVALLKNIVLCGHSAGSHRALPDTENKSPAPPARPGLFENMRDFGQKFRTVKKWHRFFPVQKQIGETCPNFKPSRLGRLLSTFFRKK